MNKLFIGIDISMDSTGVCFIDDVSCKFLNIFNILKLSKDKNKTEKEIINNDPLVKELIKIIDIIFVKRHPVQSVKKIGLSEWNRKNIINSKLCSTTIVEGILKHASGYNNIYVNIENYSYTKNTNNIIQMVEFSYPTKEKLSEIYGLENIFLVTAPEVKMWLGNGNYDKYDLLLKFVNNSLNDEKIKNTEFYKFVKNYIDLIIKDVTKKKETKKEVKAPIPDLIDSYFIAKWIEKNISGI